MKILFLISLFLCFSSYGDDQNLIDLESAVRRGNVTKALDIINLMKREGVDVESLLNTPIEGKGVNFLHIASAEETFVDMVVMLIEQGADVNARTTDGYTSTMIASKHGHTRIVIALYDRGADIHIRDKDGNTAPMIASKHGRATTAIALYDRGADIKAKNKDGHIAPVLAAINEHIVAANFLYNYGGAELIDMEAMKKLFDGDGKTATDIAMIYGHYDIADMLRGGRTADAIASERGNSDIAGVLVDRETMKKLLGDERTATDLAMIYGKDVLVDREAMKKLLRDGRTVSTVVGERGNSDIAGVLVDRETMKKLLGDERTATDLAMIYGKDVLVDREAMKRLLDESTIEDKRNTYQDALALIAEWERKKDYPNIAKVLSESEMQSLNWESYRKSAALMQAIHYESFNVAIFLLDLELKADNLTFNIREAALMLLDSKANRENMATMSREQKKNMRKLRRMLTTNQSFLSKCSSNFSSFSSFLSR